MMNYQTFEPHPDLKPMIQCYWTLEVPASDNPVKQRIVPDGCIEMAFVLGEDIKRYTSAEEFILQPRAMVIGQTIEPFFIEPTGYVNTFAIRFYPLGFACFVETPLQKLANKETPIDSLFAKEDAQMLTQKIIEAQETSQRISATESFLFEKLTEKKSIDRIVKTTLDILVATSGSTSIKSIFKDDISKRRGMERKFLKQIGLSPKQLGRVIRLQGALRMLLSQDRESLTDIAYENEYYDQAHFIKDFKEFTGTNPGDFLNHQQMQLSAAFYSVD